MYSSLLGTLWNSQRLTDWNIYTIRDLVTHHEYIGDVTHLKPFYHEPTFRLYVFPLIIAVKDKDEYVVDKIVGYDISYPAETQ